MNALHPYRLTQLIVIGCLGFLLAGCTSVPKATPAEDQAAKTFEAKPDKANIYVFRKGGVWGSAIDLHVMLNDHPAGVGRPGTYYMWQVIPGTHVISMRSPSGSETKLEVKAEAGRNYFVQQRLVQSTYFYTWIELRQTDEEEGKREVSKCALLVNGF